MEAVELIAWLVFVFVVTAVVVKLSRRNLHHSLRARDVSKGHRWGCPDRMMEDTEVVSDKESSETLQSAIWSNCDCHVSGNLDKSCEGSPQKGHRRRPKDTEEKLAEAYKFMKEFQSKMKHRDVFSVFGEYVAERIRACEDTRAGTVAQHEISDILYKMEMGELPSQPSSVEDSPVHHRCFTTYSSNMY